MADYSISAEITGDSSGLDKAIKDAQKTLSGFGQKAADLTKDINKGTSSWGLDIEKFTSKGSSLFKQFGIDIDKFAAHFGTTGTVVTAIAAAVVALGKLGQAMDEATANIVKGTGATGKELKNLESSLQTSLINGVGRSAAEVGNMIADLNTRFGVTGKELETLTQEFDAFSEVTGTETKSAINAIADVMAKWNIESQSTDDLMEQLTKASQMSGASVLQLTSSLKQSQSTLSAFGLSVTESISLLSVMSKNGINTEQALGGMRTALAKFSKEGKDAKDAFNEVAEKIRNASNQTEALQIATETFGQRSGAEMVKVLKESATQTEEFNQALANANGTIQKTDENSRTMKDAMNDLKAVLTGAFGQFGQAISGALKDVIDIVRNIFSLLAPTINAIGGVVREIVTGITGFISKVVYNVTDLIKRINGDSNIFITILNALKNAVSAVFSAMLWILDKFYRGAVIAIDGVKIGFLNLKIAVSKIVNPIAEDLAKAFNAILQKVKDLGDKINEYLPEAFKLPQIELIDEKNAGIDVDKAQNDISLLKQEINDMLNGTQKSVIETKDVVMESVDIVNDSIDETEEKEKESTEKQTDWNKKLIEQRIAGLEKTNKYSQELYKLKVQLINAERKEQLETAKTAKEIAQINEFYDNQIALIPNYASATEEGIHSIFDSLQKDAEDWSDVIQGTISSVGGAFGDMFTMIGENMAGAGNDYEDFSAVALSALSDVLKSLAAQLAAVAALRASTYDYASAAVAAAGAAAALVAAGVASAASDNLKKTKSEVSAVGEAAASAGKDLKYFQDRLAEIQAGVFSSSKGFTLEIAQLQEDFKSAKEASNSAYEAYDKLRMQNGTVYWGNSLTLTDYGRELKKLQDTYTSLHKTYVKLARERADYTSNALKQIKETVSENEAVANSYSDIYRSLKEATAYAKQWNSLNPYAQRNIQSDYAVRYLLGGDVTNNLYAKMIEAQNMMNILINEQKVNIQKTLNDVLDSLSSTGASIGETLISSIVDGGTKTDFLSSMKKYIRENLLKIAVYTETFQTKLAEVGTKLSASLLSPTTTDIATVRKELEELYEDATENAKSVENIVSEVFKDIAGESEDATEEIESNLTRLEEAIKSFKDTVSDLGADIASNLVDGLTNGLSQSDFLSNMKDWLRKMLVQSVVYTETMKAEIEEIGKKISEGITSGFSETSLHEIRRDLSYIFEQASSKMTNIDSVLDGVFSGYATGTENATRGLHIVGEAGPELVAFRGGERVLNNRDTMSMLSGSRTNNFNVTFNNTKDTSAFAMMSQLRQYNREMAVNSVI